MPSGKYDVTWRFAEIVVQSAGQRLFDVRIEGVLVLDDYHIGADVGHNVAVDLTFPGIVVDDGQLTVEFIMVKENAKVSAIGG